MSIVKREKLSLSSSLHYHHPTTRLFSHAAQRQSVKIMKVERKATQYEVGSFTRWLRMMCATLNIFTTVRTVVDDVPLDETITELVLHNRA